MLAKTGTGTQSQPDPKSALFLLPFQEISTCRLVCLKGPSQQEKSKPPNADSCVLQRSTDKKLTNADESTNQLQAFMLAVDQFVFLRPADADCRPGVGKIISFRRNGNAGEGEAQIQWFYRGEDLSGCPTVGVGDDEVFETDHFDYVETDSVCGRCAVTSYSDWVRTLSDQNPFPAPYSNRNTGTAPRTRSTQVPAVAQMTDTNSDNMSVDSDENPTAYDSSAIYLYCRRFFDSRTQKFFDSRIETPGANPLEELSALAVHSESEEDDYDAGEEPDTSSSESDDDLMYMDADELNSLTRRSSKRQRHGTAKSTSLRKRTTGTSRTRAGRIGATQFTLPQELGTVEVLPCRDDQKIHVREFILSCVGVDGREDTGSSHCLYISGVPGTGKTATVREVVRDLKTRMARGELQKFHVVEVNAMSLADPNLVYSELYTAVTGQSGVAPMHAAQLLEQRFCDLRDARGGSNPRGGRRVAGAVARSNNQTGYIIVVLDEMDVLLARKQKVLYDMLEWPTRKNARMAVIGIANTMDLPERMLPRLGSRLGLNRLVYPPYTSDQIQTILNMTLDQREFKFMPTALRLCAAKIGGVSGDVRRALDVCRRAVEQARERLQTQTEVTVKEVTPNDMNTAMQEMAGNFRNVALRQLSLFEKLALVSAIDVARRQGSFDLDSTCSMEAVCETAHDFAVRNDDFFRIVGMPSTFEIEEACWRLAGQRILVIEKALVLRRSRVIVNVSVDDCVFALQDCKLCSSLLR